MYVLHSLFNSRAQFYYIKARAARLPGDTDTPQPCRSGGPGSPPPGGYGYAAALQVRGPGYIHFFFLKIRYVRTADPIIIIIARG